MPDAKESPSRMTLMDSAMIEGWKWKKRTNEIEAEDEAKKKSLNMGPGFVYPNGLWECPAAAEK